MTEQARRAVSLGVAQERLVEGEPVMIQHHTYEEYVQLCVAEIELDLADQLEKLGVDVEHLPDSKWCEFLKWIGVRLDRHIRKGIRDYGKRRFRGQV